MFKWVKKKIQKVRTAIKKAQPGHWLKGVITAPKGTFLRKLTGKYWFDEVALAVTGQWAGLGADVVMNVMVDEKRKAARKKEKATQKELEERTAERLLAFNNQLSDEANDQLISKVTSAGSSSLQMILALGGIALLVMFLFKKK